MRYDGAADFPLSSTNLLFFFLLYLMIFYQIGALDRVEGELFAFTEAMKKSPGFSYFLKNPTVSNGDKVKEVEKWRDMNY